MSLGDCDGPRDGAMTHGSLREVKSVGERPRRGGRRTRRLRAAWSWYGLGLRRCSRAGRAGELGRDFANLHERGAADGDLGRIDPDAVDAELPLGQEVADRAVGVRRPGTVQRYPIRRPVPPRKSRAPIVAMHRRAAQDRDPVQGE